MDKKLLIPVDIFDTDVEVVINEDVVEALDKIDKENNDKNNKMIDHVNGFEEAFSYYCNQYKGGMIYKRVGMVVSPDVSETTLMHECLHTAWNIIEHKGVIIDWHNHEILCYLQGFLYAKIKVKLMKL